MTVKRKAAIVGRIILVQEDRFRIVGKTGKGYLLTLSNKAGQSQADLQRFHDFDVAVRVEYEGEPNLKSGVAHRVTPMA